MAYSNAVWFTLCTTHSNASVRQLCEECVDDSLALLGSNDGGRPGPSETAWMRLFRSNGAHVYTIKLRVLHHGNDVLDFVSKCFGQASVNQVRMALAGWKQKRMMAQSRKKKSAWMLYEFQSHEAVLSTLRLNSRGELVRLRVQFCDQAVLDVLDIPSVSRCCRDADAFVVYCDDDVHWSPLVFKRSLSVPRPVLYVQCGTSDPVQTVRVALTPSSTASLDGKCAYCCLCVCAFKTFLTSSKAGPGSVIPLADWKEAAPRAISHLMNEAIHNIEKHVTGNMYTVEILQHRVKCVLC